MDKKSWPLAGEIPGESREKPQGKDSFFRSFFKRFTGPDTSTSTVIEDGVKPLGRSGGIAQRTYTRPLVEDLLERIRRQNAQISYLNRLLRSSSDAVIVAEPNGIITMFNSGAEKLFEIEEDLAVGDNLFRMCTDSQPDGARISKMLIDDQRISNLRVEITGSNGRKTPALLTIDFVREPGDAEPSGIVAILKDNSALEKAYEVVEKLSLTDERTGLYNSRYFKQKVSDEHERMKREHMKVVSLLFIDVDHFKVFNDTYGHQLGDDVLKLVAEAIRDSVRKIDVPCRYGGEEFSVILPATDEAGAWILAERIRRRVEAIKVPVKGKQPATVTCSIGVRTHRPENGDVGMFIHEADLAVYQAKQTGRNRTVAFQQAA